MKKSLFLLFAFSVLFCSAQAGVIRNPGRINLRIISIVDTRPTIKPFMDPVDPFELYADDDELILSAESASGEVSITIIGQSGVVYSATEVMTIGSETSISVASLPAGAYTIYIYNNGALYVGQFEI